MYVKNMAQTEFQICSIYFEYLFNAMVFKKLACIYDFGWRIWQTLAPHVFRVGAISDSLPRFFLSEDPAKSWRHILAGRTKIYK
jgi:hypothetical protein